MARIEFTLGANNAPTLSAYMADRARASFIMGPLGSGKTYGSIQRILAQMCEQEPNELNVRPSRWIVIRNTYPDLMGTTIKDFREIFTEPHLGRFKMGGLEPPTFHAKFMLEDQTMVEAEVVFMALDREQHVTKLRGVQATGAWFNETKELNKAIVDMADARIGRYPSIAAGGVRCTWHGMIGDTNAPDEDHWYAQTAEVTKPKGWNFFRQPGGVIQLKELDHLGNPMWAPNPEAENVANLPPGYYENITRNKDPSWIKVNVANEYGFYIDGKPVHANYADSVHCPGVIPYRKELPLLIGVDFGRTPAAAIIQVDPAFGRKSVIDEFCTENMSAALFGPELRRYLSEMYGESELWGAYGDPSAGIGKENDESTAFTVMHAAGIPVQPAAENNSQEARRAAVAVPLKENCMDGRPRLLVSAKAKMIRKGLQGGFCYKRMHTSNERYTEKPDKNQYSHPVEALEYALMGAGEYHQAIRHSRGGRRSSNSYIARVE